MLSGLLLLVLRQVGPVGLVGLVGILQELPLLIKKEKKIFASFPNFCAIIPRLSVYLTPKYQSLDLYGGKDFEFQ